MNTVAQGCIRRPCRQYGKDQQVLFLHFFFLLYFKFIFQLGLHLFIMFLESPCASVCFLFKTLFFIIFFSIDSPFLKHYYVFARFNQLVALANLFPTIPLECNKLDKVWEAVKNLLQHQKNFSFHSLQLTSDK